MRCGDRDRSAESDLILKVRSMCDSSLMSPKRESVHWGICKIFTKAATAFSWGRGEGCSDFTHLPRTARLGLTPAAQRDATRRPPRPGPNPLRTVRHLIPVRGFHWPKIGATWILSMHRTVLLASKFFPPSNHRGAGVHRIQLQLYTWFP